MTTRTPRRFVFFLGGQDLEMAEIRRLLEETGVPFHDRGLDWGARASAYRQELEAALESGAKPVLVELEDDLGLGPESVIHVDHHGERAGPGRAASLHQVFALLDLPPARWTRRLELVAANDRGYVPALRAAGASPEEVREIRREDRAAQGITHAEEAEAERAARAAVDARAGGRLGVAHLAHGKTAALVDRLQPEMGGAGPENLLVWSPGEVNFFGSGALVAALDRSFPGGWYGGALPERGFWGHGLPVSGGEAAVERCLEDELDARLGPGPVREPAVGAPVGS
jgi:hypothetical protein